MDCIRPGPPEIRLNGVSQAGYWYQRHRHEASPGDVPSNDHTERKKYDEFTHGGDPQRLGTDTTLSLKR